MVTILDVSYSIFSQAAQEYSVFYYDIPEKDGYVLGAGTSDIVYVSKAYGSNLDDFVNNFLLTAYEVEKEGDIIARPTLFTGRLMQNQYDLTDNNFIYVGNAAPGIATSDTGWTIVRYAKDSSGNPIDKKNTKQDVAIWDNRSLETYK